MLYSYRCKTCQTTKDQLNRIEERRTHAPICCGESMGIFISKPPLAFVDREIRYRCPVTNEGVTSRKQRNEIMARNGLADANDLVNQKTIDAKVKKHAEFQAKCKQYEAEQPQHLKEAVNEWAKASIA